MDFNFSEDQRAVLEVTADFARTQLAPKIEEIDQNDRLPEDFFQRAGEAGLIGIAMGEAYGGLGMSYETLLAAYAVLSQTCPAAAIALTTTLAGLKIIEKHGSQALKDRYLEAGVLGELAAGMAFTEPGTGSDPKQLLTTATQEGERIRLNGVKRFITNAAYRGPMAVFAKDADDGTCSAYLIDKFCEGYSISTPWDKVGLKGSPVFDVFLDDVVVPVTNRLGEKGKGFEVLLSESSVGKMSHAAASLGILDAVKALAIQYAKEKLHRNQPITRFQAVQLKIAKICERTESVRWMVYRCGQLADQDTDSEAFKAYAAMAKAYAADTVPEVALLAMNVMGAYGPMREYSVERFLRDAVVEPHVEVVSDVQRIIFANYYINEAKSGKGG